MKHGRGRLGLVDDRHRVERGLDCAVVLDRRLGLHPSPNRRADRRRVRFEIRLAARTIGNLAANKLIWQLLLELAASARTKPA